MQIDTVESFQIVAPCIDLLATRLVGNTVEHRSTQEPLAKFIITIPSNSKLFITRLIVDDLFSVRELQRAYLEHLAIAPMMIK